MQGTLKGIILFQSGNIIFRLLNNKGFGTPCWVARNTLPLEITSIY